MTKKKQNSEEDFIKELALQIEAKRLEQKKYILNTENHEKFIDVYTFFKRLIDDVGGRVKYIDVRPESVHADVSVEVPLLDFYRDTLKEFTEILSKVDVFGITPTTKDTLLIDASVNYLWMECAADE